MAKKKTTSKKQEMLDNEDAMAVWKDLYQEALGSLLPAYIAAGQLHHKMEQIAIEAKHVADKAMEVYLDRHSLLQRSLDAHRKASSGPVADYRKQEVDP